MNGARALLSTLVDAGVDVCFANPGTSEMHFVAALDDVPAMRGVLCLFEGVVDRRRGRLRARGRPSGGHAAPPRAGSRQRPGQPAQRPAGPHARSSTSSATTPPTTPATTHRCSPTSRRSPAPSLGGTARRRDPTTWRATQPTPWPPRRGRPAVSPRSFCRQTHRGPSPRAGRARHGRAGARPWRRPTPSARWPRRCARVSAAALLLGGRALRADGLHAASRVAAATGAALLGETFPANLERGAGIPAVERLAYLAEMAQAQLDGVRHLVLVDATSPVSFFAYPDKASDLVPPGCTVHALARPGEDAAGALEALADAVGAPADGGVPAPAGRPDRPTGALVAESLAAAVGATLARGRHRRGRGQHGGALRLRRPRRAHRAHDWLTLTGGAIGIGLPMATGAAVAAPERPVLCLQADGSAMYTLQALWTQAREGLNVTTVVLSNRSYAHFEHGAPPGRRRRRRPARPPAARPDRSRPRLLRPGPRHGGAGPAGREGRGPGRRRSKRGSPSRGRR